MGRFLVDTFIKFYQAAKFYLVGFFTLGERKILGASQRRRGPNVIGLLQLFSDGFKKTKNFILVILVSFYQIIKPYLIALLKFFFYRNDKFSKLKVIAILLFFIIYLTLYKISLFFNIEFLDIFIIYLDLLFLYCNILNYIVFFLFTDLVQVYLKVLFFYLNFVSLFVNLLLYVAYCIYKLEFFDEEGMPTYELCLVLLSFKIIQIVLLQFDISLHKLFLNKIEKIYNNFIKKS